MYMGSETGYFFLDLVLEAAQHPDRYNHDGYR